MFEFYEGFDKSGFSAEDIKALLPNWKTRILKIIERTNTTEITFCIAAQTIKEVRDWLKAYEAHTNLTYSIRSTERNTGKYVIFKQRLRCHHSTGCSRIYDPNLKNKTKNTNCPSTLNITLRAIKARHRYKVEDKKPDPLMPCVIVLLASHNHDVNSVEALRFRRVSGEVKDKLISLFEKGHTATSALQTLKIDINLNSDDATKTLADRKYTPDYNYVYRLYKDFKSKHGPVDSSFQFIQERFDEYNLETQENSAKFFLKNSDYVMCICSPLMRRVHQYIKESSEMVFVDSSGTLNRDGCHIYTILTYSKCGSLPLAVIITSTENKDLIINGFMMLKDIMGKYIFGGNINGPKVFLTDNCDIIQSAIKFVWNNSTCLLSVFHVLQSVWRWLINVKHGIEEQDRDILFEQFRSIIYSSSLTECNNNYEQANNMAEKYPAYQEYLESYWERNHLWALIFRTNLCIENNSNTYIEAGIRFVNEKIFEKVKSFNLIQIVDFILSKFSDYYKKLLLDLIHNKEHRNLFGTEVKEIPEDLIDKIQLLSNKMYLVPSETTPHLYYMTNTEILQCTCTDGNTGKLCKHLHWVLSIYNSNEYNLCIDDNETKTLFYLIATGDEFSEECLVPICTISSTTSAVSSSDIDAVPSADITNMTDCKPIITSISDTNPFNITTPITTTTTTTTTSPIIENQDILMEDDDVIDLPDQFNELTKQIFNHFANFYSKSPAKTVEAIKKFEQNLSKMKTVRTFNSACNRFGCG